VSLDVRIVRDSVTAVVFAEKLQGRPSYLRAIALHQITSHHADTERRKLNVGWQVRSQKKQLLTYMLTFNYYEKTMGRLAAGSAFGLDA
jgi:hypothetical protein